MEWGAALTPDGRYELLNMIAEGEMVACRVEVSGTQEGEVFGIPPTGAYRRSLSVPVLRSAWRGLLRSTLRLVGAC